LNNNRNNNNNNRRRGRGSNNRQQGGQQLNRIDSRARGNAPQMLEKYRKLAHDSHLNGDRVNEEYYLQFADHYFRVIADQRVRQEEQRQPRPQGQDGRPAEYGEDYAEDDFYGDANSPYDRAGNYAPSVQGSTQGNGAQNAGPNGQNSSQGNGQGYAGQGNNGQNGNYQAGNGQGGYQNGNGQGQQGGNPAVNQGHAHGGEQRSDQPRAERGRRNNRDDRGERTERNDRADRRPRAAAPSADEQPVDTQPAAATSVEGEATDRTVYEQTENPFVRADRAPRTPRARKPRRDAAASASGDVNAGQSSASAEASVRAEPVANLDPAMLPPAISRRDDTPEVAASAAADEAPAKPKRRTRRASPPADDAAGALETLS